jgi:serine/threonine protein kinase
MTPAGEVWALGAVLYHMMVGRPPEERNMQETIPQDSDYPCYYVDAIPNAYSSELRAIVYDMLKTEPEQRPTALQLSPRIGAALSYWRDKTAEEYILK